MVNWTWKRLDGWGVLVHECKGGGEHHAGLLVWLPGVSADGVFAQRLRNDPNDPVPADDDIQPEHLPRCWKEV